MREVILIFCLVILVAGSPAGALSVKDSSGFTHSYEGDVDPFSAGAGNAVFDSLLRGGSPTPALGTYGGTTGYIGDSAGGILDLNTGKATPNPQGSFIYFGGSVGLNAHTGWTVEFRVKAIASNNASGASSREGLVLSAGGSEGKTAVLQVGTDRLHTNLGGTGLIGSQNNSSDFVTYRMTVLPGAQSWNLYRNGEILSGYVPTTLGTSNDLSFGDQTGSGAGHHQIDYIRFDTSGAFAPLRTVEHVVNASATGKTFHRAIMGQNIKIPGSQLAGGNSSLRGVSGGLFDDIYDWKAHVGVNSGLEYTTLDFLRAARDLNSEPIITVNARGVTNNSDSFENIRYSDISAANRASDAADMVRYVNHILPQYRQGDSVPSNDQSILDQISWSSKQLQSDEKSTSKVTYWEIGNEPEIRVAGYRLSHSDYRNRYGLITSAMLAVDPTIKVGATVAKISSSNPIDAVIQDLSLPLDFVVYHPYDDMQNKWSEVWVAKIINNDPNADIAGLEARLRGSGDRIRGEYAAARSKLISAGRDPNQVEHILSEWNPMNWDGFTAQSSQAMVLASAESVFTMADLDIRAANLWGGLMNGNGEYPVVKLFRKMAEHMGDTLIDQYKDGNLHVYTVRDSQTGAITIWGLNFSDDEDSSLAMSLENMVEGQVDVTGMTLGNLDRPSSILDTADRNPIGWTEGALAGFDTDLFTIDVPQASVRLLVIESVIPEPGTLALVVVGMISVVSRRNRFKHITCMDTHFL